MICDRTVPFWLCFI